MLQIRYARLSVPYYVLMFSCSCAVMIVLYFWQPHGVRTCMHLVMVEHVLIYTGPKWRWSYVSVLRRMEWSFASDEISGADLPGKLQLTERTGTQCVILRLSQWT
mgnify:CR=1 FL=1